MKNLSYKYHFFANVLVYALQAETSLVCVLTITVSLTESNVRKPPRELLITQSDNYFFLERATLFLLVTVVSHTLSATYYVLAKDDFVVTASLALRCASSRLFAKFFSVQCFGLDKARFAARSCNFLVVLITITPRFSNKQSAWLNAAAWAVRICCYFWSILDRARSEGFSLSQKFKI